jgi:ubiquitin carboxyl-terminal hydrolase 5/13
VVSASEEPEVNEGVVAQLMEMGFPRVRCVKGLLATGNSTADAAMDWLIMHMEDPGEHIRLVGTAI